MLNLSQSSLMVEGCLRGIMSSQEGKSFEEIVGYAKYVMGENKIAKLDEQVFKPDVEVGVDSIVDILISNIEMKWTEDDIFRIEEKDLFTDISKMNERNIVKVNNELGRKRTQPKQQKAESKKAENKQQKAEETKQEAKEEKKAETKQEAKADSFRDILIKVNDELVRKRREEAKQKAESKKAETKQEAKEEKKVEQKQPKAENKKVDEPKQEAKEEKKAEGQPKQEAKEEKKAETKDIRQKLIDLINCKTIYNLIPNQEKGSFEEFKKQNQEIELEKIEDTNVLEMIDLIKEMSDDQYNKFKNNIHNAKSEQDILKVISEIEMDIIANKARTFEGFISVIKDEFKIKNLTEDEMLTMYDIFYKAVEDNEAINDALDKALDRINQKVNQKINRIEKDKSINESEERWLRYFHLNLKNKKRGTMKAFLYKKCELYENAFGGNLNPNNLSISANRIHKLLGVSFPPKASLYNLAFLYKKAFIVPRFLFFKFRWK